MYENYGIFCFYNFSFVFLLVLLLVLVLVLVFMLIATWKSISIYMKVEKYTYGINFVYLGVE